MEKYNNRGLSGLLNLGNTCFINSFIQCLSHTYEFNDYLDNKYNEDTKSVLLNEWNSLRKLMWSKNCSISPKRFIHSIHTVAKERNIKFQTYSQEDISEFAFFIIDLFNDYLKQSYTYEVNAENKHEEYLKIFFKKEHSIISDLFYGCQVSCVKDKNNNIINETPEMFSILTLHILKNKSINDLIKEYCSEEILKDDNAYEMPVTKKMVEAKRNIYFYKTPTILVLILKRYTNTLNKNKLDIVVNDLLNLEDLREKKTVKYELYAVNLHFGFLTGGHYKAAIKNNKQWYLMDDLKITKINFNAIKNNSNVYCLFYRKIYS